MQTIYLITTTGSSDVEQHLNALRLPGADVQVISLRNKDEFATNREMTEGERRQLFAAIDQLLPNEHPIVITHATDTLVETGLRLQRELLDLEVPIILTGAVASTEWGVASNQGISLVPRQPAPADDGLQNLTESLFAAHLLGPGMWIVMHGQVFPVHRARKDKELGTFVRVGADEIRRK